jgi:NADP-dependent 3-hydroxy acid dehydrogenase YdfG
MSALAGQTALVTGASSGIGRAIALELAHCNVKLCLVGRSDSKLRQVRKFAEQNSDAVFDFPVDLSESRSVGRIVEFVQHELGELNILVHSAGVISLGRIEDASVEDFRTQIEVNLLGPYLLTKELLPFLKESKGQVVFVNSSIVNNPRPGTIQFAATQHALKGVADCLRSELNEFGIRVVSAFIGRTATPRQEWMYRIEAKPYSPERLLQAGDVATLVVSVLSLPASAEVTDIHLRPTAKS